MPTSKSQSIPPAMYLIALCGAVLTALTYFYPEQILPHMGFSVPSINAAGDENGVNMYNKDMGYHQSNSGTSTAAGAGADERFTKWFMNNGGIIDKMRVASFEGMGRGFAVTSSVLENDRLLYIPSKLIFSRRNMRQHIALEHKQLRLFKALDELGSEEGLIAWLLYEKALGTRSFFKPYIDVLPEYVPSLLHFTTEQLDELQNAELRAEVEQLQQRAREDYNRFVQQFFPSTTAATKQQQQNALDEVLAVKWPTDTSPLLSPPPPPLFTEYLWACTMINSRGLRFSGEVHMAPMADIFNFAPHPVQRAAKGGDFFLLHHVLGGSRDATVRANDLTSISSGSSNSLEDPLGSITVFADRDTIIPIRDVSSSQLLLQYLEDYGDNPDEIYFKYHGFVPTENPFRCVQLVTSFNQSIFNKLTYTKKKILHALEFPRPPARCVEATAALGRGVEVFLAIIAMTDAEAAVCLETAERSKRQWNVIFAACNFHEATSELYVLRDPAAKSAAVASSELNVLQSIGKRTLRELQEFLVEYLSSLQYTTTLQQDATLLRYYEAKLRVKSVASSDALHRFLAVKYRTAQKKLWLALCDQFQTTACDSLLEVDNSLAAATTSVMKDSTSNPTTTIAADTMDTVETESTLPGSRPITPPVISPSSIPAGDEPVSPPQVDPASIPAVHPVLPPEDNTRSPFIKSSSGSSSAKVEENQVLAEESLSLEARLDRFNKWFNDLGPKPNLLEARVIPGFRIGTVATQHIRKNALYIGVPARIDTSNDSSSSSNSGGIMNSAVALQNSSVTPLISQLTAAYSRRDDFHELLFFLLSEYFALGSGSSRYWPYLSLLPTAAELDIPLFWSAEQVLQRLGPSHLVQTVLKYQKTTATRFETLSKMSMISDFFNSISSSIATTTGTSTTADGTEAGTSTSTSTGVFTFENYRWATAILDSRSIWWSGRRNLVPMLDFVNCGEDPENPERLHSTVLDPTGEFAITYSPREFKKGEQLFENYGQPNHIYFVYHGFVLEENWHDCAHIDLLISEKEMKALDAEKAKPIIERLRLSPGRASSMAVCLSSPVAQSVWALMALKTNDFESLAAQQRLGSAYPAGVDALILQIDERLVAHESHPPSEHEGSNRFLRTERAKFQEVKAQLLLEKLQLERDAAATVATATADAIEELPVFSAVDEDDEL